MFLYFNRLVKILRHFRQNATLDQHPADGLIGTARLAEGVPQLLGLPIALDAYKVRQCRRPPPPSPTSPRIRRAPIGTFEQYFLSR